MNSTNSQGVSENTSAQNTENKDASGGNAQHDWNKNTDGSELKNQRDDEMRKSFAFTDNYAEGEEFSGRFNLESNKVPEDRNANDFKPLTGSLDKTVE